MLGLNQPRQLRLAGFFYGSLTQINFSKPRMRQINEVDQFSFDNLQHGLFIWDLVDIWLESFHVQNVWLESSNHCWKQRNAVVHHQLLCLRQTKPRQPRLAGFCFVVRFNQIVNDSTKKLKHTNSRLLIFHLLTLAGPDGEPIKKWEFETGGKVSSSPAPLSVAGECG